MKIRAALIAASIAVLAGGLAVAGPAHRGPRGGRSGERLERIARKLDLTDAQRARIREIVEQHRDAGLGDAARASRDARRELRALIHDPAAGAAAVRDAAERASRAEAELAVERHRAFAEAFTVLTPEQQQKAKAMVEKARQRTI